MINNKRDHWTPTIFSLSVVALLVNLYFRDRLGVSISFLVASASFGYTLGRIPWIRCGLKVHNWSLWGEQTAVNRCRISANTGKKIERSEFVVFKQERRCQDCRMVEVNEVYS